MPGRDRWGCAGAALLLVLAGCGIRRNVLAPALVVGVAHASAGRPAAVAVTVQSALSQMGLMVRSHREGDAIRLESVTPSGMRFILRLTADTLGPTPQTLVRIDWDKEADEPFWEQLQGRCERRCRPLTNVRKAHDHRPRPGARRLALALLLSLSAHGLLVLASSTCRAGPPRTISKCARPRRGRSGDAEPWFGGPRPRHTEEQEPPGEEFEPIVLPLRPSLAAPVVDAGGATNSRPRKAPGLAREGRLGRGSGPWRRRRRPACSRCRGPAQCGLRAGPLREHGAVGALAQRTELRAGLAACRPRRAFRSSPTTIGRRNRWPWGKRGLLPAVPETVAEAERLLAEPTRRGAPTTARPCGRPAAGA